MLLPSGILGSEIEGTGVLKISWEDDGLVSSFTRQLNTQVPSIECHEGELQILRDEVLLSKVIKPRYGVAEGSSVPNMLPSQGGETGWDWNISMVELKQLSETLTTERGDRSVDWLD